ncbi:uncharacterized protein DSM5745_09414 [Aspergillus mulundensis]|uniref:Uncharacterized protein n=1 Tax=Aspergillus mulundensis TaxID=1810919 RepID=A0A3D8QV77_9EURO|nr:hypothetical protein DSM5745_09414 [Aspergillus mulundensis]RDW65675.1 hypothetical protein DSM5745_09414 [Aspergillus mulundensis]
MLQSYECLQCGTFAQQICFARHPRYITPQVRSLQYVNTLNTRFSPADLGPPMEDDGTPRPYDPAEYLPVQELPEAPEHREIRILITPPDETPAPAPTPIPTRPTTPAPVSPTGRGMRPPGPNDVRRAALLRAALGSDPVPRRWERQPQPVAIPTNWDPGEPPYPDAPPIELREMRDRIYNELIEDSLMMGRVDRAVSIARRAMSRIVASSRAMRQGLVDDALDARQAYAVSTRLRRLNAQCRVLVRFYADLTEGLGELEEVVAQKRTFFAHLNERIEGL